MGVRESEGGKEGVLVKVRVYLSFQKHIHRVWMGTLLIWIGLSNLKI